MNPNLKPEERDLTKLVTYFKKRAEILIIENRLDEEYKQMLGVCDKLIEQLEMHAKNREEVRAERELLKGMVKDNAQCPKCFSNANLKVVGTEANEKGWKSNKYKCRKCNITFVWNAPNNPWDMISYVENFISQMEIKLKEAPAEEDLESTQQALEQMKSNLEKLKPVVEASDLSLKELEEREVHMAEMVHKFRKHLMIEKIRMEN